jgi:GDP-D-mannose dehydratase
LEISLRFSEKSIDVQENTPEKLRNTDEDIILGDNTKIKKLGFEITQSLEELLREMYNYWIEFYKKEI